VLFIVLFAIWNAAARVPSDATRNAAGIVLVGQVPSDLPTFRFPALSRNVDSLTTAVGITLVGFVESIAVSSDLCNTVRIT
jgi:MFS superfamily sulfate permease-like transporter